MRTARIRHRTLAAAAVGIGTALGAGAWTAQPEGQDADAKAHPLDSVSSLVAAIRPTEGHDTRGVVRFYKSGNGVRIVADVRGLAPGSVHGFHIHQYGDATKADGTSAGGHYNPKGHDHALPSKSPRHAGDLGNLEVDDNGRARLEMVVHNISIAGMKNPIIGRSVVVHADRDDGGQPTGNAGARVGIGVIGVARIDRAGN